MVTSLCQIKFLQNSLTALLIRCRKHRHVSWSLGRQIFVDLDRCLGWHAVPFFQSPDTTDLYVINFDKTKK